MVNVKGRRDLEKEEGELYLYCFCIPGNYTNEEGPAFILDGTEMEVAGT